MAISPLEVEKAVAKVLRVVETGAPAFASLIAPAAGPVLGQVLRYLGPSAGLVADLIDMGHQSIPAEIAKMRSSVQPFNAATADLEDLAKTGQ